MVFRLLLLSFIPFLLSARPGYFPPWGKDCDLAPLRPETPAQTHPLSVQLATGIIHFHQNVISPIDGPRSHFRPSSSAYMLEAMHKHGFLTGFLMGCDRLMRENGDDWHYKKIESDGKLYNYDPVP